MADNYIPPVSSWRLPVFVDAPLDEVYRKVVTCDTCPVRAQCDAGEGGTGWTCSVCRATGVYVDKPVGVKLPKNVLILDCHKHNFHTLNEAKQITRCSLCNGAQMELEAMDHYPLIKGGDRGGFTAHYIATAYAHVPVERRQAELKAAYEKYKVLYKK